MLLVERYYPSIADGSKKYCDGFSLDEREGCNLNVTKCFESAANELWMPPVCRVIFDDRHTFSNSHRMIPIILMRVASSRTIVLIICHFVSFTDEKVRVVLEIKKRNLERLVRNFESH